MYSKETNRFERESTNQTKVVYDSYNLKLLQMIALTSFNVSIILIEYKKGLCTEKAAASHIGLKA